MEPQLVVEIAADGSVDQGRLRHLARLIRVRPDLDAQDLPAM